MIEMTEGGPVKEECDALAKHLLAKGDIHGQELFNIVLARFNSVLEDLIRESISEMPQNPREMN